MLFGEPPEPYDPRLDPRARPVVGERNKATAVHVDQCAIRQVEIKLQLSHIRIEAWKDRRLLIAIIALLLITKVIDLGQFAAFMGH